MNVGDQLNFKNYHDIHIDTKRIVLAYSFTINYETLHLILIVSIVFLE